jgi:hypothetical protein
MIFLRCPVLGLTGLWTKV